MFSTFVRRCRIFQRMTKNTLWHFLSLKRDQSEKTSEYCHTPRRNCRIVLILLVACGLLCLFLKLGFRSPLPEHLTWMMTQRDLNPYILPDDDTNLLLPKSPCNDGRTFLAVVVCSAVPNFEARQAIRNSWAQDAAKLRSIRVFFLLGKSPEDTLNALVANESRKYSDVIQQDFLDTYNNLTLKSVMLLKWVNRHCANAKYVMKVDDDVFVNLPNLFRFLKARGRQRMLVGLLMETYSPIKDRNSKWFVPDVVFPDKTYPPYLLGGTGYVMSGDTIPLLYRTALGTPFLYLEDIFITGVCASRAGLKPFNNEDFKFFEFEFHFCELKFLITAHKLEPAEMSQMWNNLQNPFVECKICNNTTLCK